MKAKIVATPTQKQRGKLIHRQEVRWQIALPFMLAVVALIVGVVLVIVPYDALTPARLSALSDVLTIVLLICPSILCFFALFMGTVALIIGVNRLHDGTQKPLERLEGMVTEASQQVERVVDRANQTTIEWSSRLAPLMLLFDFFEDDIPQEKTQDGKPNTNDTHTR